MFKELRRELDVTLLVCPLDFFKEPTRKSGCEPAGCVGLGAGGSGGGLGGDGGVGCEKHIILAPFVV